MAELNDDLLEDALNFIANSEASKPSKPILPERNDDDRLNELFENLVNKNQFKYFDLFSKGDNFADDILKNLADVNVEETNELIENVLGELISKEILYEPFVCLKEKIEKEIEKGNLAHEKGLSQIKAILSLMDENEKASNNCKTKDKMMQLIYELQEQGDLWASLTE